MTMQPPRRPQLCPHGGNPTACPLCYQLAQRMKAKQPTQQPQRTSLDPQITKGKVVTAEQNPVLAAQLAKKNAALGVTPEMLAAQQAARTPAAAGPTIIRQDTPAGQPQPMPQHARVPQQPVQNPHQAGYVPDGDVPQADDGSTSVYIDTAELERMFPKHDSIIDKQPSHPDGHNSSKGSLNSSRTSSRAPVTKGRTPGM